MNEALPSLREDVPCERWLAECVASAHAAGRGEWGVPAMSKITAFYTDVVHVPVAVLAILKGQRGEQLRRDQGKVNAIAEALECTPLDSADAPYLEVAYNGEAWISEGNHRIMAAIEARIPTLPVHVRYFDGGQRQSGPLSPASIERYRDGSIVGAIASTPIDVVVYHGTKASRFEQFATPAWFSPSRRMAENFAGTFGDGRVTAESRVITAKMTMARPFVTHDWTVVERYAADAAWVRNRRAEGYDGVWFVSDDGDETEFVIFDSAQACVLDHGVSLAPACGPFMR